MQIAERKPTKAEIEAAKAEAKRQKELERKKREHRAQADKVNIEILQLVEKADEIKRLSPPA